jgi:hypothetical protein
MAGKLLCVLREPLFSPGKEKADEAILRLTVDWMTSRGMEVELLSTEALLERWGGGEGPPAELILSMAQGDGPLEILSRWESQGALVLNRPGAAYECSRRERLFRRLQETEEERGPSPGGFAEKGGFFLPRSEFVDPEQRGEAAGGWALPLWVKRGDYHALGPGDVVLAKTREEVGSALLNFSSRGVKRALLQEHVEGEVLKFYGVGEVRFWWWRSVAARTHFPHGEVLQSLGLEASRRLGLDIYGGDAILTPSGRLRLIDLNDWPSFTGCQADASDAIADFALERLRKRRLVQAR